MLSDNKSASKSVLPAPVKEITSDALLAGARELVIKHFGENYRLRLTSQGKLILTK